MRRKQMTLHSSQSLLIINQHIHVTLLALFLSFVLRFWGRGFCTPTCTKSTSSSLSISIDIPPFTYSPTRSIRVIWLFGLLGKVCKWFWPVDERRHLWAGFRRCHLVWQRWMCPTTCKIIRLPARSQRHREWVNATAETENEVHETLERRILGDRWSYEDGYGWNDQTNIMKRLWKHIPALHNISRAMTSSYRGRSAAHWRVRSTVKRSCEWPEKWGLSWKFDEQGLRDLILLSG